MTEQMSFNPQDIAKTIMDKSFLKKRGKNIINLDSLRETGTGSNFFQDNRIRSCSYVKES